jgi:signal transduction histidine kinase
MRGTIAPRTAVIHAFIHDLKIPLAVIELGVRSLRQPRTPSSLSAPPVASLDAIERLNSEAKDLANRLLNAAKRQYSAARARDESPVTLLTRLQRGLRRQPGANAALGDRLSAMQQCLCRMETHLLALKPGPASDEMLPAHHLKVIDRSLRNCRSALKLVDSATRLLGSKRLEIHREAVGLGALITRALVEVWELRSEAIFSGLGKNASLAQVQSTGRKDGVLVEVGDHLWRRTVRVDRERVNQVLVNLLLNACKHRHTRIAISAGIQANHLHLSITDDGDGIAPADDTAPPGTPGPPSPPEVSIAGHGLGLLFVQVILAEMGGRLTVRSAPGNGATFSVILPCRPQAMNHPG